MSLRNPYGQFSVHTFRDLETAGFSSKDYSRLKFGSALVARQFGDEMADRFFEQHRSMLMTDRCVVIPSAYNVVEIAATLLAEHFMNRLNDLLSREGHRRVEWATMNRTMNYVSDYSFLPKAERRAILEDIEMYINRDFIRGKVLLFVDDVTITGTHEYKIVSFLKKMKLKNPRVFCYYAAYSGEIAAIESELNRVSIQNAEEYCALVREPGHRLVVRAVRFLLERPVEELRAVLSYVTTAFVDSLYHACLSKEYDKFDGYRENFELIRAQYDRDREQVVPHLRLA